MSSYLQRERERVHALEHWNLMAGVDMFPRSAPCRLGSLCRSARKQTAIEIQLPVCGYSPNTKLPEQRVHP